MRLPPPPLQVLELLAEHLSSWGCHIAFPELSYLTLTQLRKFMKTTPVDRFRCLLLLLLLLLLRG